jgi:O-antigen ligase
MSNERLFALTAAAQIAALCIIGVASYTAVYVPILAALVGCAVWARQRTRQTERQDMTPALALLLVAFTVPFQANAEADLVGVLAILPAAIMPGLVVLLLLEPRLASAPFIGLAALIGAALSALAGMNEHFVFGVPRPGVGNNPIHYADLALTLGFVSLLGLFGSTSQWRFIHLLGPVLAAVAVFLSGSRGAMLSLVLLTIVIGPLLFAWFYREAGFLIALAFGVICLPAMIYAVGMDGLAGGRAVSIVRAIGDAIGTGDLASLEYVRAQMYGAAWSAFWDSPWIGHGFSSIYSAAYPYLSARVQDFGLYDHLHADLANFAVMSGVFGIAAYCLLLAAPFMALRRRRLDRQTRRAVLTGALVLSLGYFSMGLTNAMFGILPQTGLYAVVLANIIALSRRHVTGPGF